VRKPTPLRGFAASFVFLALAVASSPAAAFDYELDLDDCDADGCQGSDLFLGIDDLGGGSFSITLQVDSTGYTGATGGNSRTGIGQIGFKAFSDVDASNVTLTSAPGGLGAWDDPAESSINANGGGCGSGDTSDHICVDGFVNITTDAIYTWTFSVTNATLLAVSDWHIGGQYCNGDPDGTDCQGKIISTSTTPVPEPSAALVFGAALLAAAPHLRRRR